MNKKLKRLLIATVILTSCMILAAIIMPTGEATIPAVVIGVLILGICGCIVMLYYEPPPPSNWPF